MELFLSWNILKFLGALSFIFITTADDSIWLIPLITGTNYTKSQQLIHIIVFISTLQFACFLSWISCILFGNTLEHLRFQSLGGLNAEILLQIFGVILTWCIALFFYLKKIFKRVRTSQQQSQVTLDSSYQHIPDNKEDIELSDFRYISNANNNDNHHSNQSTIETHNIPDDQKLVRKSIANQGVSNLSNTSLPKVKIGFVMMMTFAGALDEMLCFPSFLFGTISSDITNCNIFSIQELSVGCLAASIILVLILSLSYQLFKPLFDLFNRIPLYVIISMLGIIQTFNLFYDLYY